MAWTQFLHNVRQLFTFLTKVTDNIIRANSHTLLGRSRSELRKVIFSRKAGYPWHRLTREVLESPSLGDLRTWLDKAVADLICC